MKALRDCLVAAFISFGLAMAVTGCAALESPRELGVHIDSSGLLQPDSIKKKILILDFLNYSPYQSTRLTELLKQKSIDLISSHPDWVIVDPKDLLGFPKNPPVGESYDLNPIYASAQAMGVSVLLVGSIEELLINKRGDNSGLFRGYEYETYGRIRLQLFDVVSRVPLFEHSHKEELNFTETQWIATEDPEESGVKGISTLERAFEPLLKQLSFDIRQIHWRGFIAQMVGHFYYLNGGVETGLRRGQLLKVYSAPIPIRDPISGKGIGVAQGSFKGLLRIVDFVGNNVSVATLHSGGGVHEKDRVEVYTP